MMMGFGFIGLVVMIVFWGLLIVGAVFLVRALFPSGSNSSKSEWSPNPSSREILDLRYARGEINGEEYEMMKDDLDA
ncbi:MAG: hypothetical protein GTO18_13530 [Anaerolineales bacterium]|nr:hypothetical protein [Anaerolineales bacterium]